MTIEDVLDNELTETHADIAGKVEKALDDRKKQEKWKAKLGVSQTKKAGILVVIVAAEDYGIVDRFC